MGLDTEAISMDAGREMGESTAITRGAENGLFTSLHLSVIAAS